jgi:hypothetical protein
MTLRFPDVRFRSHPIVALTLGGRSAIRGEAEKAGSRADIDLEGRLATGKRPYCMAASNGGVWPKAAIAGPPSVGTGDPARRAGQDPRAGRGPRPLRSVPDGRGGDTLDQHIGRDGPRRCRSNRPADRDAGNPRQEALCLGLLQDRLFLARSDPCLPGCAVEIRLADTPLPMALLKSITTSHCPTTRSSRHFGSECGRADAPSGDFGRHRRHARHADHDIRRKARRQRRGDHLLRLADQDAD